MARPPKKSGDDNREKYLRVRLTALEEQKIIAQAKACGMKNVSRFARGKLLNEDTGSSDFFQIRELLIRHLAHIGKIGSNANQIAKVVNRRELIGEEIGSLGERIKLSLNEIDNVTKLGIPGKLTM